MKIGIITHPLQYNYGGILQAYALQTVLENLGHDANIIRRSERWEVPKYKYMIYAVRLIKKILLWPMGYRVVIFREEKHNQEFKQVTKNTWTFVEKYIHSYFVKNYFLAPPNVFDGLIVGSDQVWREKYITKGYGVPMERMFFDYARNWNIKRLSYAASFGTDEWEFSIAQTKICSELAKKFDAISVREESGVSLCKRHLGVDAVCMLDPTLLLQKEDYNRLISKECLPRHGNTILSYILDNTLEKEIIVKKLKKDYDSCDCNSITIPKYKNMVTLPSIEDWLSNFRDSKFIFTDSFHGMVFSIIFNVPFAVYVNKNRGSSRFVSLLNLLGLKNRIIESEKEYDRIKNEEINWTEVNKRIDYLRNSSVEFLKCNLNG